MPLAQRLTGADYIGYMRHRLGKTPASRHQLVHTFNDAGREIFQAGLDPMRGFNHQWSWTVAENVVLPIKANEELVRLPDDFGTLIAIEQENRVTGTIIQTGLAHLLELRADSTISQLNIYICFDAGPKDTGANAALEADSLAKWAAIYPVQSADRNDVRMTYTRTWIDFAAGDDASSGGSEAELKRVPNIPAEWERLLKLCAMRMASEMEDGMPAFDNGPYDRELQRLVAYDANRQTEYGRVAHSVKNMARGVRGYPYPHRGITRP